jgi:hypothetical protein
MTESNAERAAGLALLVYAETTPRRLKRIPMLISVRHRSPLRASLSLLPALAAEACFHPPKPDTGASDTGVAASRGNGLVHY